MSPPPTDASSPEIAPFSRPMTRAELPAGRASIKRDVSATADERDAVADAFDLDRLDALRLEVEIAPMGADGWRLDARLTAVGAQRCVATLEPAPFAVDAAATRLWSDSAEPVDPLAEIEFDSRGAPDDGDDEVVERTPDPIDLGAVALETLSLALDPYPRAEPGPFEPVLAGPPGEAPLDDEAVKPFAGLKAMLDAATDKKSGEG